MIQPSKFINISVVIPIYNEEENIKLLIEKIDQALRTQNYEIILVDDGSTDRTRIVVQELNHPKVIFIELKKNYGQSLALAAGIDYAEGDYIVTMDGYLQNDPSDILMMYRKAVNEDWDLVTGIRHNRQDNFLRTFPSKIANGNQS